MIGATLLGLLAAVADPVEIPDRGAVEASWRAAVVAEYPAAEIILSACSIDVSWEETILEDVVRIVCFAQVVHDLFDPAVTLRGVAPDRSDAIPNPADWRWEITVADGPEDVLVVDAPNPAPSPLEAVRRRQECERLTDSLLDEQACTRGDLSVIDGPELTDADVEAAMDQCGLYLDDEILRRFFTCVADELND